jgi:transporter family-2 protein
MTAVRSTLLAATASFAVGALVALQARVNGDLAERLGGGFSGGALAATLSFTAGFLALTGWLVLAPRHRRALRVLGPELARRGLQWWQLLGGLFGALLILTQAGAVPTIGVAIFTVAVVAGQTGGGLAVDRVGLGPAGRQPVTGRRVLAALVAVGAVVLSVSGRLGSASFAPALLVACVVAGAGVSVQSALNGQVARATSSPVVAAWVSFGIGLVALGLVVAAVVATGTRYPALPGTWWLYTGGLMGVAFVTVVAGVVRLVGVLVVTLATVAGQVVGAVLLDAFAPVAGQELQAVTVVGAVVTVLAVVLAVAPVDRFLGRPRPAAG